MKKLYKYIVAFLTISLVLSRIVSAQTETSHWAQEYVDIMIDNNIMEGYEDGNLYLEQNVTRAEYAKMFSLSAGIDTSVIYPMNYADVNESDWYYEYIMSMHNYIPSPNASQFNPNQYLTRIDMVTALSYFDIDLAETDVTAFSDTDSLIEFQKKYLNYSVQCGYIYGYEDGTFHPNGYITRAEAAAFLSRVFFSNEAEIEDQIRVTTDMNETNKSLTAQGMRGYAMKVHNNLREENDGKLITNSLDYPFTVNFSNYTETGSNFVMKVFYDNREVKFKLSDTYETSYTFYLNSMESIELPLYIDNSIELDDYMHKLTVAIFDNADINAADIETSIRFYGICLDYEIYKNSDNIEFKDIPSFSEYTLLTDKQYSGIMVTDAAASSDTTAVSLPSYEITCERNEELNLYYYMGNDYASEYLMLLLLDWNQIYVDGENIYCQVDDSLAYNNFTITVPSEPGKYELCAICIYDPYTHVEDRDAAKLSYRFTIIVE